MFVSESVTVAVPLAVAQHRLLEFLQRGNMDSLASAAYADGVSVLARAGVLGLSKTVEIQSIPAFRRGPATIVPLRWIATGPLSAAFPVLDANLELTAAGSETELMLIGSYRPPFGPVGAAVDRLVLHGVATLTIKRFAAQLSAVAAGERLPAAAEKERGPVPTADGDAVT